MSWKNLYVATSVREQILYAIDKMIEDNLDLPLTELYTMIDERNSVAKFFKLEERSRDKYRP